MKTNFFVIPIGIAVCFIALIAHSAMVNQGDTTWQVLTHIDKVLDENQLPPGQDSQLIKIAEDDTVSIFVVRMMPGAELGPHFHKGHDEIEYVIRGKAELFVGDQWVEFKAGSIHFNPTEKVHAARNRGDEPLIVLIAFTPAMRETDRHFVE